MSVLMVSKSA
jgi:hypothetical protein